MARALVKEIKDTRKNYIINGDMRIAQRGTSFATIANTAYSLDRWRYGKSGAMVHTVSQGTDVPTAAQANYLFQNSYVATLTTPDTAIAAGDYCLIQQFVEGYNWANLAQKPMTLSFWVKATLTGTYCVGLRNSGTDRSYVAEYTINATNTWEYKVITIAASPSAGTWNYTNGLGLNISWVLAAGTTYQTTAGSWQTGDYFATANQVNGVNTGATSFLLTGVKLNEGSISSPFSLFGEDFEGEVAACQRYYEKSYNLTDAPGLATETGAFSTISLNASEFYNYGYVRFRLVKRAAPIVSSWSTNGVFGQLRNFNLASNQGNTGILRVSDSSVNFNCSNASMTSVNIFGLQWTADAEL